MESIIGTDMETRSEKTGRVLMNEFWFPSIIDRVLSADFLQDSQVLEKNLESQQDQDHAAGKLCL